MVFWGSGLNCNRESGIAFLPIYLLAQTLKKKQNSPVVTVENIHREYFNPLLTHIVYSELSALMKHSRMKDNPRG